MSRPFSKVYKSLWQNPKYRALKGDLGCLAVAPWLIAGGLTPPSGVFRLPFGFVQVELGLDLDVIRSTFEKLEGVGFLAYDHEREVVWVRAKFEHEYGDVEKPTDRRVKGFRNQARHVLEDFRECSFAREYYEFAVRQWPEMTEGEKPLRSPFEAPSEPLASPSEAPSKPLRRGSEGTIARVQTADGRRQIPESESTYVDSGGDPPPKRHAQRERIGRVIDAATDRGATLAKDAGGALAKAWRAYRAVYDDEPAVDAMIEVIEGLDFAALEPRSGPHLRYLLAALREHLKDRKRRKKPRGRHPPGKLPPGLHPETLALAEALEGGGA